MSGGFQGRTLWDTVKTSVIVFQNAAALEVRKNVFYFLDCFSFVLLFKLS